MAALILLTDLWRSRRYAQTNAARAVATRLAHDAVDPATTGAIDRPAVSTILSAAGRTVARTEPEAVAPPAGLRPVLRRSRRLRNDGVLGLRWLR